MVQNQQKKSKAQEERDNLDLRLKGNYAMLIRATELAALASFQTLALLEDLHAKGVINKEEVMAKANGYSEVALQKLRDMAFYAEAEIDKETRETPPTP